MKGKVPFSPLTNTAALVCSDLFQASLIILGKSQLCVGVAGMIQQRNLHGWKPSMPMEKQKFCGPLAGQMTEIPLFVLTRGFCCNQLLLPAVQGVSPAVWMKLKVTHNMKTPMSVRCFAFMGQHWGFPHLRIRAHSTVVIDP